MSAALALSLALAGLTAPTEAGRGLDAAVRGLLADLDLATRHRPPAGEDLAVAVRTPRRPREIDRLVLGLLLEGTRAAVSRPVRALPEQPGAPLGELDAAARLAGAEWLLLASVEPLDAHHVELRAELRAVDRGLWARPPAPRSAPIAAFAARSLSVEASPSVREDAPRTGGPIRLGRVEDHVVALAACELDGRPGDELVVVSMRSVSVWRAEPERSAPVASLALEGRLAAAPVRDPIGSVVCADLDGDGRTELAIGHGRLAEGWLLRLEPGPEPGTSRLAVVERLPGLPLAVAGPRLWLGRTDAGRARFAPELVPYGPSDAGAEPPPVPPPFLALLSVGPGAAPLVLDTDYRLRALGGDGAPIATSGLGCALARWEGDTLLATTSSRAVAGDRLRIHRLGASGGRPIELPEPVVAGAFAEHRRAGALDLVLALLEARGRRTALVAIPVGGTP
jgi:hypothetical protein